MTLNILVIVRTPLAKLPRHLTPSASHATPAIIPLPYRARVHSRSMGCSWASAGKNGIRSSYDPFTV
jgi:hypothetical protein